MPAIRIFRPKRDRSVSPATVLPTALLVRLLRLQFNFTVVLDGHAVGKIGSEQARVFNVDPGEHRLRMRFVLLRRSKEMHMSLEEDEERVFFCGSNGMGWPTLWAAAPEDLAKIRESSVSEPRGPGNPDFPN